MFATGGVKMKVKELIKTLENYQPNAEVLLSSDEELNVLFRRVEINYLDDSKKIVLFGLSGSEVD